MQEVADVKPIVTAAGVFRTLRSSTARWTATTRDDANSMRKTFPISMTPICALSSERESGPESAAHLMRKNRAALIATIVKWTGQRKYTVNMLVRKLILRCQELKLPAPGDPRSCTSNWLRT